MQKGDWARTRRWQITAGAVMVLSFVAAACTGAPPAPSPAAKPALHGWMLAASSVFDGRVSLLTLPSGRVRSASLPPNAIPVAAAWASPGSVALALLPTGSDARSPDRLYRVNAGGTTQPVGRTLLGVRQASAGGGLITAATCRDVLVTAVADPGRWRSLGAGCLAAPAPDGTSVTFSDGSTVWTAPADGSGPVRRLWAIEPSTPGLGELGRHGTIGALAPGPQGLAIRVDGTGPSSGAFAIVVLRPDGSVQPITAGSLGGQSPPELAWQPGGRLLAFNAPLLDGGGTVQVADATTGARRIVAIDPQGFSGLLWSPSGAALVASGSDDHWLFVDLAGDWITRIPSGGAFLLYDWGA
ncbi:MAG TPA: hypothetical protein VGH10_09950 [Actinomycetota bacterium]|jgi:hypothetical protein